MIAINPIDVALWTLRRNEKDVVNLYSALSPLMQLATGGNMLNFGYWDDDNSDPLSAQENLCGKFAAMAELETAKTALDVGSGLSAPAVFWKNNFPNLSVSCVNINYSQLSNSGARQNIGLFNSSSTKLPFSKNSVDRVLALESAQHFKPLSEFISESRRVLTGSGLLVMAVPVTTGPASNKKLGILRFTWSSEHYSLDHIRNLVQSNGFAVSEERLIGPSVYVPLADYYLEHRDALRKSILEKYPSYVEKILFRSIQKMKKASEEKIIDYVLLKCHL